jgi:hypothetical protein
MPNAMDEFKMNSRTVFAVSGVILLLVGALLGYLYGTNSAQTTTTTTTSTLTATLTSTLSPTDTYDQVANAFLHRMSFLSSRNVSAIVSQHEANASVVWRGSNPLGQFNGTKSIFLLMNVSFIGHGDSFAAGNETYTIGIAKQYSAWVNSSFAFLRT